MPPADIAAPRAAVTVLGDRANLLLVREAFRDTRRYQGFKDRLGISDAVLASRLRDLVDLGVLRTERYVDHPPRHEYRLTEAGDDLWPTVVGMWVWERRWGEQAERLPAMFHATCGNVTTAEFGCAGCAAAGLSARDVDIGADAAVHIAGRTPIRRYRRATWRPAADVDVFRDIDSLVGDRWTVSTLSAAMLGVERFGDFQRTLDISPPLLSQRLAHLVDRAVLERAVAPSGGAHQHYRLTARGQDLMPILVCNFAWANRWYTMPPGPQLTITHHACVAQLVPAWFCTDCGKTIDRRSIEFRPTSRTTSVRAPTDGVRERSRRPVTPP